MAAFYIAEFHRHGRRNHVGSNNALGSKHLETKKTGEIWGTASFKSVFWVRLYLILNVWTVFLAERFGDILQKHI